MKIFQTTIHACLLTALLLFLPLSSQAGFFGPDALVTYKGVEFTKDQLLSIAALLNNEQKQALRDDAVKLDEFIRSEVIKKYLIKQARKTLADDASVAVELRVASENERYRLFLLERSKVPVGFPKANQIRSLYEQNIQQFVEPDFIHIRQIFLPVNAQFSMKKRMQDIRFIQKQIKLGKKTFTAYAKSRSEHKISAKKGGDMGWVSSRLLLPQIRNALKGMSQKSALKIIKTDTNVRLIELLGIRAGKTIPLEKVKSLLVSTLRTQKRAELEKKYLADILKKNPISIKDFNLLRQAIHSEKRDSFKHRQDVVIATMGNVRLDLAFFLQKVDDIQILQHGSPLEMNDAFLKKTLIGNLLLKQLVLKKEKKSGFDRRDDVKRQVQSARDAILVKAMLGSLSEPPASYPSSKQLSAAYKANQSKLVRPDMVHLGQIFIARSKDKAQNKKIAQGMLDLYRRLKGKPNLFGALAAKYSQNVASKNNAGDIGWVNLSALNPSVLSKVKHMHADQISSVIKTDEGWRIVKLFARKKAGTIPLAEVKPLLRKALRDTEKKQRMKKVISSLLASKSISIDADEKASLARSI